MEKIKLNFKNVNINNKRKNIVRGILIKIQSKKENMTI